MSGLDYVLDRTVTIAARRETVFRYFTDSERFAAWWGEGSTIEPPARRRRAHPLPERDRGRRGGGRDRAARAGRLQLRLRVGPADPDRRLARHDHARGAPPRARCVRLHHELPSAEVRDEHVQGWRYQLAVFANVVAKEAHAGAARSPTASSAAGARPTPPSGAPSSRRSPLGAGLPRSLLLHLGHRRPRRAHRGEPALHAGHGPGAPGRARSCQGVALVDWSVKGPDGNPRGEARTSSSSRRTAASPASRGFGHDRHADQLAGGAKAPNTATSSERPRLSPNAASVPWGSASTTSRTRAGRSRGSRAERARAPPRPHP